MGIINDTIVKMYEILESNEITIRNSDIEFDSIRFGLKSDITNIAVHFINGYCGYECKKILKQEFISALSVNISDAELEYLINIRYYYLKDIPDFLDIAVNCENSIYYELNCRCDICVPLMLCVIDMIKKIMIEYYYEDWIINMEEDLFVEDAEKYIEGCFRYLKKNLETVENNVKFFLQDQEVIAPEKGN